MPIPSLLAAFSRRLEGPADLNEGEADIRDGALAGLIVGALWVLCCMSASGAVYTFLLKKRKPQVADKVVKNAQTVGGFGGAVAVVCVV